MRILKSEEFFGAEGKKLSVGEAKTANPPFEITPMHRAIIKVLAQSFKREFIDIGFVSLDAAWQKIQKAPNAAKFLDEMTKRGLDLSILQGETPFAGRKVYLTHIGFKPYQIWDPTTQKFIQQDDSEGNTIWLFGGASYDGIKKKIDKLSVRVTVGKNTGFGYDPDKDVTKTQVVENGVLTTKTAPKESVQNTYISLWLDGKANNERVGTEMDAITRAVFKDVPENEIEALQIMTLAVAYSAPNEYKPKKYSLNCDDLIFIVDMEG